MAPLATWRPLILHTVYTYLLFHFFPSSKAVPTVPVSTTAFLESPNCTAGWIVSRYSGQCSVIGAWRIPIN